MNRVILSVRSFACCDTTTRSVVSSWIININFSMQMNHGMLSGSAVYLQKQPEQHVVKLPAAVGMFSFQPNASWIHLPFSRRQQCTFVKAFFHYQIHNQGKYFLCVSLYWFVLLRMGLKRDASGQYNVLGMTTVRNQAIVWRYSCCKLITVYGSGIWKGGNFEPVIGWQFCMTK